MRLHWLFLWSHCPYFVSCLEKNVDLNLVRRNGYLTYRNVKRTTITNSRKGNPNRKKSMGKFNPQGIFKSKSSLALAVLPSTHHALTAMASLILCACSSTTCLNSVAELP